MKSTHNFLSLLSFIILTALNVIIVGCGDDPVGPVPAKDYVVYIPESLMSPFRCFAYHTLTGQVDSFNLPCESRGTIAISPDGDRMYLATTRPSIAIVDIQTKTLIGEYLIGLEVGGPILSRDGRFLAVSHHISQDESELLILRTSNMEVVFQDSIRWQNGVFSPRSNHFYCITSDSVHNVPFAYIVALDSGFAVTKHEIRGSIGSLFRIVPDRDEDKWFMYFRIIDQQSIFQVYDVNIDSIIFSQDLWPGAGDMELTVDGRYVVFTQPGSMISSGAPYFTIFDVHSNSILEQVRFDGDTSQLKIVYIPGSLCQTPDGRHIVGLQKLDIVGMFDFDMDAMKLKNVILLGYDKTLRHPACQGKR